jgi:hypothetical protein
MTHARAMPPRDLRSRERQAVGCEESSPAPRGAEGANPCDGSERQCGSLWMSILAGGCSQPVATHIDAVRPVKTMLVTAEEEPRVRTFLGRVKVSQRVELAFRVPQKARARGSLRAAEQPAVGGTRPPAEGHLRWAG